MLLKFVHIIQMRFILVQTVELVNFQESSNPKKPRIELLYMKCYCSWRLAMLSRWTPFMFLITAEAVFCYAVKEVRGGQEVKEAGLWLEGRWFDPWIGRKKSGRGKWMNNGLPSLNNHCWSALEEGT